MNLAKIIIGSMEPKGEDVIEKSQKEMIRDEQELLASRMIKCFEAKDASGLANYLSSFFKACEMEEKLEEDEEGEY